MFDQAVNAGRISFDGFAYVLTPGFEDHPVVGASWYGAIKYCNWLTLDQGLGSVQRCYSEGPSSDLDEWRPMTISKADWQARDLSDTERQSLVDGYRGYRLPMDDGWNNAQPFADSADGYNEWYKAAAWDATASVNRLYGFGRDAVSGPDANYSSSGDPFEGDASEPRTTPIGFYDGVNLQGDGVTSTAANGNAYSLEDMSGNVTEWVQDKYAAANTRALRGGSWANFAAQGIWIRNTDRNFAPPSLAWGEIGFRVVRVPKVIGDATGDGMVDLNDYAVMDSCLTGPGNGPLLPVCGTLDFDGDNDVDLDDFAELAKLLSTP